ncbi:MAG: nucleotidyltransferase domain-containing protein [Rubrivivax sp.]
MGTAGRLRTFADTRRSNQAPGAGRRVARGEVVKINALGSPEIERICRKHGIRRLSLFGSRLKGQERPDSDLDLLVEFEPDRTPGLLGISAMEIEFGHALRHKVDLRTAQDLSPYFRDEVVRVAQLTYTA